MAFMGVAMVSIFLLLIFIAMIAAAVVGLVLFIIGLVLYIRNRRGWNAKRAAGQKPGWKRPLAITFMAVGSGLAAIVAGLYLWLVWAW